MSSCAGRIDNVQYALALGEWVLYRKGADLRLDEKASFVANTSADACYCYELGWCDVDADKLGVVRNGGGGWFRCRWVFLFCFGCVSACISVGRCLSICLSVSSLCLSVSLLVIPMLIVPAAALSHCALH